MNFKKSLFTILLLVFFVNLSAQQKQNLKKYYKNVFIAEKLLLDKNYLKAAKHYEIAFKNKDWAFQCDLSNALYCEIMSKSPAKNNTQKYTKQLKKIGISSEKRYNKLQNYDESLFFLDYIPVSYNDSVKEILAKMKELDQKHRHNINIDSIEQILNIRISDSLNIIEFKKIIEKINIFDERIVRFGDYDVFFNHWSQSFPDEYNKIALKALNAVKTGTLDARNYAKNVADIIQVRANFTNNFTQYGTNFFIILYEKDSDNSNWQNLKANNFFAFSKFDKKNKEHKKWLKQTDKKRKKIFLDKTVESSIVYFNLAKLQYAENFVSTQSVTLARVPKRIIETEFCKIYSENPNAIYIFPENNDINCK